MDLSRAHVNVVGDVQGVGFRYATERRANKLGLTGWVRNCADGSVEAVFEGERDSVEQMLGWCRRGPSSAVVTDVKVDWLPPTGEFDEFKITF